MQIANPADYIARYGAQLEDPQTLLSRARQAGVIEDIVSHYPSRLLSSFVETIRLYLVTASPTHGYIKYKLRCK